MVNRLAAPSWHLICLLLITCFLASCSHVRRDGPPDFYVDETKIPNAVPKDEPLAKYGNMDSYRVFGRRYYVLKSSRNYEAIGTASWYGTKFHKQRTSSGERYNMLAMTAAHKTLPLPTYVEVTNLKNQRKVIVKVNDRGPFENNRLIDLSYVAAKKLGMMGHGTAIVKVKAIDPTYYERKNIYANVIKTPTHSVMTASHPVCTSRSSGPLYLQAGIFKNKLSAEKLKSRLHTLVNAPVRISTLKPYRVQIGPIKDTASANRIVSRLKAAGIKANRV